MALKLITKYQGIDAEYWRINQFQYDDVRDEAYVHLWLYFNKEASLNKENKLTREVITIQGVKQFPLPEQEFYVGVNSPRDLIEKLLYLKLTEPVYETKIEDGQEIQVQVNKFAEAEDI